MIYKTQLINFQEIYTIITSLYCTSKNTLDITGVVHIHTVVDIEIIKFHTVSKLLLKL